MKKTVAIIGSGPAALMLAATLDESTFDISIYEQKKSLARKFLVAGDGGFNLTHSEAMETFITRYTPADFLKPFLQQFTNQDLRNWLLGLGIDTYVGSSKRVFPLASIKPAQVLQAIVFYLKNKKVQFFTQHTFQNWTSSNALQFESNNETVIVDADIVVFALGGSSWSVTGADGICRNSVQLAICLTARGWWRCSGGKPSAEGSWWVDLQRAFKGILAYAMPLSSLGGNSPARMLICTAGSMSTGISKVASRLVRIATNSASVMPSCTWTFFAFCSATVVSKFTGRSLGG